MEVKINHQAKRIHEALGIKSAYQEEVCTIIQDFFVNKNQDGPGHSKTSLALVEAVELAKKEVFNVTTPINEYEATLIYLGYLVGAEISAHRERMSSNPFGMTGMIPPSPSPLPPGLIDILKGALGRRAATPTDGESFMIKCGSPEEAELHRDIMLELAKGNFEKAQLLLSKLREIKGQG